MSGRILFKTSSVFIGIATFAIGLLPVCIRNLIWQISNSIPGICGVGIRYCVAKSLAKKIGENVFFGAYTVVKNWRNLTLGNNVSIHEFCFIDAVGGVEIQDNVSIAHGVSLITFDHSWDDLSTPIKYNPIKTAPIRICSDVWIGCGAKILKGVTLGTRTVIGAGSVVVKDSPGASLLCGTPAKEIKKL